MDMPHWMTMEERDKLLEEQRDTFAADTVNIIGYDAGQFWDDGTGYLVPELFNLNFARILQNFHEIGNIPKSKLMLGFGVGDQDAGASWEGTDVDIEAVTGWGPLSSTESFV